MIEVKTAKGILYSIILGRSTRRYFVINAGTLKKKLGRDFNEIARNIKPSIYRMNSNFIHSDVSFKQHQRERKRPAVIWIKMNASLIF